MEFKGGLLRF